MKNYGIVMESCGLKFFRDFFKTLKVELCIALELICSVACSDGNGEGINARSFYKVNGLIGIGICGMSLGYLDLILNSGKFSELSLNNYAPCVSVINDLLCFGNIFLIIKM